MSCPAELYNHISVPPQVREIWKEVSPSLLPLQEMLISSGEIFGSEPLLIHAPTSSGKTFLVELAMITEVFNGGRCIYVVPLRVQAEEVYKVLKSRYEKLGIKTVISTRDYRAQDTEIEKGNFHIAVMVYEKVFQSCARNPLIRNRVSQIVFDDVDILFDFERGSVADFLISLWKSSPARKLYLSASLPMAKEVAEWLGARYVYSEFRPVELRKGVLFDGVFYYLEKDSKKVEEERFWSAGTTELKPIAGAVRFFLERDEQTLIFMKTRNEVKRLGWELTNVLDLPPAEQSCERLKRLEPTQARDMLMEFFQNGIGIHHSDLLPEEREVVEDAFKEGEIKLLICTNTLAKGLNLPVDNVIISPEKWAYGYPGDTCYGGCTLPLPLNEFENMAGRAGRYRLRDTPARAILIANTEEEKELLFQWYIRQGMIVNLSKGTNLRWDEYLITTLSSCDEVSVEELEEFVRSTWWGSRYSTGLSSEDPVKRIVASFLRRALGKNLCSKKSPGFYSPTTRGRLIATKGISVSTFEMIEKFLKTENLTELNELDAILLVGLTEDGYLPQFEITREEVTSGVYQQLFEERRTNLTEKILNLFRTRKAEKEESLRRESKAIKLAFVMEKWLNGVGLREIEDEFCVSAGQVVSAGQRLAWLMDAGASIAELVGSGTSDFFRTLSECLRWGVPTEMLSLTRGHNLYLTRPILLALHRAGLSTWEKINTAPISELLEIMPKDMAKLLKGISQSILSPTNDQEFELLAKELKNLGEALSSKNRPAQKKDTGKKPRINPIIEDIGSEVKEASIGVWDIGKDKGILLAIDARRPGEAWVEGMILKLPEKQYRLLCLLAKNVGCCVGYEEIYRELWGDIIVEDNQMAYQKCLLLHSLSKISPEWKTRIRTVPKRGFILELLPSQILLNT